MIMYAKFWRQMNGQQRSALANRLKTSTEYLRLVLSGHKIAGPKLAKNLHIETDGIVDKHLLRPDIF